LIAYLKREKRDSKPNKTLTKTILPGIVKRVQLSARLSVYQHVGLLNIKET